MMYKRVTIIGLGLIGGSLGLAIKDRKLAREVIGVSRRRSTLSRALAMGAADKVSLDFEKSVKDSDLVILAAPVLTIIDIAKRISRYLKKGAILVDAGSTKKDIVKNIESILPDGVYFVGSHPLAGSEKSGIVYAEKDLFKGTHCILTKTKKTDSKAMKKVKRFWNSLGMKVIAASPEEHDRLISKISHLPHAAAVSIVNSCKGKCLNLAAGGFKDTTRIASGSPELWIDIFMTNRENLAADIKVLKKELSKIEKALKNNESAEILKLLKKAKTVRDSVQ